jgi:hypothetical protein
LEKYISPKKAYKELVLLINNVGENVFRKKPQYQKDREKYCAAIFLCGIEKLTGRKWFINLETSNPPDFKAISYRNGEKQDKKLYDETEVEIIEIPENIFKANNHREKRVAQFLFEKKLNPQKKAYPLHYILCVYFNFTVKNFNLARLHKSLSEFQFLTREIWAFGNNNPELTDFFVAKIWPVQNYIDFSILDVVR